MLYKHKFLLTLPYLTLSIVQILLIPLILLISLTLPNFINAINTIIQYLYFIIKTRQSNLTNIISSNFVLFTLNSVHLVSYHIFFRLTKHQYILYALSF